MLRLLRHMLLWGVGWLHGIVAHWQASGFPSFRVKIIISVLRDCTVDVMMSELEGVCLPKALVCCS